MLRWIRVTSFLTIALVSVDVREARAEWPTCDEGGPGATTCSIVWEYGSCQITCNVGSACCSSYNGCYCLYDM
jgi:hypothetical protein